MDKVKKLLNEVGKQLDNQGFIAKIFIPIQSFDDSIDYYQELRPGEVKKHYSAAEVNQIRNKATYKDNEIIITVNGV